MSNEHRAEQVSLESFIEVATRAALRAAAGVNVELNPQPLPPGKAAPASLSHGPIIIGIVIDRPAQQQ